MSKEDSVKTAPSVPKGEELVEYTAPLLPGVQKQEVLVSVNGDTIRIKRGVPVMIKRKHYGALQDASQQAYQAMQSIAELQRASSRPFAAM